MSMLFNSDVREGEAEVPVRFLGPPGEQAETGSNCPRSFRTSVLDCLSSHPGHRI